mgnify:FL=1
MRKKVIVVGAGIVGLAAARRLSLLGYDVDVFERNPKPIGASIRNFGMIWPVGQPNGPLYERALSSRAIWKEVMDQAKGWYEEAGSLHMAYRTEEMAVIEEFVDCRGTCTIQAASEVRSPAVNKKGLLGALWSPDEMIVDPREAISVIPALLADNFNVTFHWNETVTAINYPKVLTSRGNFSADMIYVCSGADFEMLYPEVYRKIPITKCKLQMMRLVAQPNNWRIGPALCGGLTLIHYAAFKNLQAHQFLRNYYQTHYPDYLDWALNVMVSQNGSGELILGDSHEYGPDLDPFDRAHVNAMILDYMKTFAQFKDWSIEATWNGIYPKMTDGSTEFVCEPEAGVRIINGLGGAGMTLSFGLMEEVITE